MAQVTLRPNANGDDINLTPLGATYNYQCVDEATPDEDSTRVSTTSTSAYKRDLYNMQNPGVSGTINWIRVYIRCRKNGTISGYRSKEVLKIAGVVREAPYNELGGSYGTTYYTWSNAYGWDWSDVNSMQAGVSLISVDSKQASICTQVYVVVDYTPGTTHEGSATLAGAGSLSAAAGLIYCASAALSGAGILAAGACRILSGAATLAGAGSLAVAARNILSGVAILSGAGSLAGQAVCIYSVTFTLSGQGALSAIGVRVRSATAAMAGVGSLAAAGSRVLSAAAALSGVGTLSAIGSLLGDVFGTVTLVGQGSISVIAESWHCLTSEQYQALLAGQRIEFQEI
jgi:hypothetical protein